MFIKFPMPCHVVGKLLLYATKGLHFFELTVNYLITRAGSSLPSDVS